MRKLLYAIVIVLFIIGIGSDAFPAKPQIAPPDIPKQSQPKIVNPEMFPELQQETLLIEYIVGHINDYLESKDWSYLLDPEESQARVNELAAMLIKYGYDEDLHFIELKEVLYQSTLELAWYELRVVIFYKGNPDVSSVNIWHIDYIDVVLPDKKEDT